MLDLILKVNTEITANNLDDYAVQIKKQVESVSTELVTDDDFANAKELVKAFKKSEDSLKDAKESIFDQGDLQKINDTIIELHDMVREKRLALNKLVTAEEKSRKQKLLDDAFQSVEKVHRSCKWSNLIDFPSHDDFIAQIKGKKLFDSMKDALDRFVGITIQDINSQSSEIENRAETIKVMIEGYESLFSIDDLLKMEGDASKYINARISAHKAEIELAAKAKAEEIAKQAELAKQKESQQSQGQEQVKQSIDQPIPEMDPVIPELRKNENEPIENYIIRISLHASNSDAVEIARKLANVYSRENVSLTKLQESA